MGLQEHKSAYVDLIFLLGLPFKTEIPTLETFLVFRLWVHVISLNLIPFITSIETEASFLALAKSIY